MRKTGCLVAFALTMAAAGPALAADMPVKAAPLAVRAYDWSGFYAGVHVGALFGEKDWLEIVGPFPGQVIHPHYSGLIGGGQVGFNYQMDRIVLGAEGDWGFTNASGDAICIVGFFTCGVKMHWAATLAARAGYAWDRVLVFVKGGAAWLREDYPVAPGTPGAITLSQTRTGWIAGGGLEYGWTNNWSVKLEYNYLGLGTDRLNFGGAIEDITQHAHIVKAGLNYRFDWR